MKEKTRLLLQEACDYCNEHDKSTGFMLEYMQDVAKVDLDCVLAFLDKREKQLKKINHANTKRI